MDYLFSLLSRETAPAWVQAIGSLVAIVVAVGAVLLQRNLANRDEAQTRYLAAVEKRQRLVAALRAEIEAAIDAADRQDEIASATLAQLQHARNSGVTLVNRGPLEQGSIALTDAIIFKGIAAELGLFPPVLVSQTVSFYTYALEIGRLATLGASMEESLRQLQHSMPRLRMVGAIALAYLEQFEVSGFDPKAILLIDPKDAKGMAARARYPLDDVLRERGLGLSS